MDMLLIDGMAVSWLLRHSLVKKNKTFTDVDFICSFCSFCSAVVSRFNPDIIGFAWDSRKSLRREIYPEYKQTRREREKTEEEKELDTLMFYCVKFLKDSFIENILECQQNYEQEGFEADDIMGWFSQNFDGSLILAANDADLYQLLKQNVCLFKLRNQAVYTDSDFFAEYGVSPMQWVNVKMIAGCLSDNVRNVEGVREKTAIKYLLGQLKETSKAWQAIEKSGELQKFNRPLVELPFANAGPFNVGEKNARTMFRHLQAWSNPFLVKIKGKQLLQKFYEER